MNKLCITSSLLAGVGVVGATAVADDLAITQTRDNTTPSTFKNATTPTDFSGGVAGAACVYDNYNPLDDLGAPASQRDLIHPFGAEAADDFLLPGTAGNDCLLSQVIFAVTWFNNPGGETPFSCWSGVNITIYEDAQEYCGPGFAKGPGGEPRDNPPFHIEYCRGAVKCEIELSMANVTGTPLPGECNTAPTWEIIVLALEESQCKLQTDHKYWIAIAPVMGFAACGQTAIVISANPVIDHQAQQNSSLHRSWRVIPGNLDACPPDTPPEGSRQDLSIGIAAIKQTCPWDLANDDGVVDAHDLAVLLGNWGNPYGPVELANLLGSWGPCR